MGFIEEPSKYDYFKGKLPNRTYISKRLVDKYPDETTKNIRIVSKVVDCENQLTHAKLANEIVLRITPTGRQQLVAKIYEDNKGIFSLIIQKFTTKTGMPHEASFCFRGNEIKSLKEFIDSVKFLDFTESEKSKIEDETLRQVKQFLSENRDLDLLVELAQTNITKSDVVAIAYRKEQLAIFEKMLSDNDYFKARKESLRKRRDEDVWQGFFEENPWIFGYGLNYVFNSPLEGEKLEQVVKGADLTGAGKRADCVLKTSGAVNSLCLVEIKNHKTELLKVKKSPYRADCWQTSDELNGGIAQAQKTISKTVRNLGERIELYSDSGDPTGESIFSYHPKSYLVIGGLDEFKTENGINKEKFSSFELFRKNVLSPEIITYDELYERARFIVHNNEETAK